MMIDLKEAVEIVQKESPGLYPRSCTDFGEFWLFAMGAPNFENDDQYATGRIFPIVYKETGKLDEYDITSDMDAFLEAELIF